jgi:hypothetical protein
MSKERRESPRKVLNRDVVLKTRRSSPLFCTINNISADGAYLELGDHNLLLDTHVLMSITMPAGQHPASLELSANIARVTDSGVGLHFVNMDINHYASVLGLVY